MAIFLSIFASNINKLGAQIKFYYSTRSLALFIACLHIIVTSGFAYGWNALLLILKGEKKYYFLCPESNDSVKYCTAEQLYLTNLFTFAYTLQYLCGLPLGLIVDYLGPQCPIIGQLASMLCFLGLALFKPSPNSFDWNFLFLSIIFISRYFISTRYYHFSNLFPDHFNLSTTLISTSTIISGGVFPLMYIVWEYANIPFKNILIFFVVLQSPFTLFCLIQPKEPFNFGQKVYFSRKNLRFMVIQTTLDNSKHISVNYNSSFNTNLYELCDYTKDNFNQDLQLNYKNDEIHSFNSFISDSKNLEHQFDNSNHFIHNKINIQFPVYSNSNGDISFKPKHFKTQNIGDILKKAWNEFLFRLNTIFVKLLLPNILFSIWFFFFSVFLHAVNYLMYEKSGDESKTELFSFIFSCIIPFGFIGSLIFAFLGDLTSTKIMFIGYIFLVKIYFSLHKFQFYHKILLKENFAAFLVYFTHILVYLFSWLVELLYF